MEGQLSEHPLAELIREITSAGFTGALRLSRERAKVIVYFAEGQLIFAGSNLRVHRLREVLKASGFRDARLESTSTSSDEELADALIKNGSLTSKSLQSIRNRQACDALRVALLWTDGHWQFDQRVRLAGKTRVQVDIGRLLLECARHLPFPFVKSRFDNTNGTYSAVSADNSIDLFPSEGFMLSRANAAAKATPLAELTANGIPEEDSLRSIYALSLSGLLQRSDWPLAFGTLIPRSPRKSRAVGTPSSVATAGESGEVVDDAADADALFARLKNAGDHYEVLDVPRAASVDEVKKAYRTLGRRFHPDRFHQSGPELLSRIESAFARIAQAYETLSDPAQRTDYDKRRMSKARVSVAEKPEAARDRNGAKQTAAQSQESRAENSFRHGMDALQRNQHDEAIRFLAEAAMLDPRQARYRAHYGHALIRRSNTRRIAETELQAAVALEPDNSSFRVMLAELYQSLGLRRRAEGEAARALAADPKNEAARAMLANLQSK